MNALSLVGGDARRRWKAFRSHFIMRIAITAPYGLAGQPDGWMPDIQRFVRPDPSQPALRSPVPCRGRAVSGLFSLDHPCRRLVQTQQPLDATYADVVFPGKPVLGDPVLEGEHQLAQVVVG